jgi:outer membrane protein assembly factor BamB
VDIQTGEDSGGPFRLGGIRNVYASPLAANGNIYVTDLDGTTIVIEDSKAPQVIAYNRLDDRFAASPIAVNDELFLRGAKFLYCIARGQ